jgi:glutathione peroxidase
MNAKLSDEQSLASMPPSSLHDFEALSIAGEPVALSRYAGRLVLVVNTASACGFTPQFEGLQALWEQFGDQGLTVIGFPSNEFGSQDPAPNAQIAEFCATRFSVTFPMMAKIEVNGTRAHPLYKWLKGERPGILGTEAIKWNFTKFLVGRDGQVIRRYAPQDTPSKIKRDIEPLLAV